jgi:hypothetical protein
MLYAASSFWLFLLYLLAARSSSRTTTASQATLSGYIIISVIQPASSCLLVSIKIN